MEECINHAYPFKLSVLNENIPLACALSFLPQLL